jgi:hypothetical protein
MTRYLLAAEADQIQDFIFRAAHLREVVGGSQIIARFGKRGTGAISALDIDDANVVVSGGGSFRVLFDGPADEAEQFGERLAEIYHRATDGTLTVIPQPEPVDDPADFSRASQAAQKALRVAKRRQAGGLTTAHLPYVAFCTSCGVGLASDYAKRHPKADDAQYLCAACLAKGQERAEESLGEFLGPFVRLVMGGSQDWQQAAWPGRDRLAAAREVDPTEDVGQFDPRKYVAYLVADGNDIGKIFDACDEQQMRRLSDVMTETLQRSLAEPIRLLKQSQPKIDADFVPALPLILGGDDLFALLPAPWALDLAQQFCREFETRMTALVDSLGLATRAQLPQRITTTASVVVCRENYPFYLAHDVAEQRLDQAKRIAKRLASASNGQPFSAVDFHIILGSQAGVTGDQGDYRATLRPYWVAAEGAAVPPGWGLQLDALLETRWNLRTLPKKRLEQLRALYYPSALPSSGDPSSLASWRVQRDALWKRIGRDAEALQSVRQAFAALGGEDWYRVRRRTPDRWDGHGLPDLLSAWDFAHRVEVARLDYEEA